jgi:hypothetical protein
MRPTRAEIPAPSAPRSTDRWPAWSTVAALRRPTPTRRASATRLKSNCDLLYTSAIARGRLVASSGQASCFDAIHAAFKDATCATWREVLAGALNERSPLLAACEGAYQGTGALGAPCEIPDECSEGLACFGYVSPTEKSAAVDGRCAAPAALSQPCGGGADDAGVRVTIGAFFGHHPDCAPGARCEGTCAPRFAEGHTCGNDDGCIEGTRCILGSCSKGELVQPGGSCQVGSDCVSPLDCTTAPGADAGTCGHLLSAGAACTTNRECMGVCAGTDGGGKQCVAYCGSQ